MQHMNESAPYSERIRRPKHAKPKQGEPHSKRGMDKRALRQAKRGAV